jgi:hypothetical protein
MGLDCSHDAWHGAYSAFSRWRHKIAEAAGYAVWPVKYGDGMTHDTVMLDWGRITKENQFGAWEQTPADPLVVLFVHSDCEGEIRPEQAGPLADALERLLPDLDGDGGGHIGDYRSKTRAFIDGLRRAVAANEPLDFH